MKRSALYYASHPEAAKKKRKYQAQRDLLPRQVRYRVELKRERRRRGIYGKGGPDMSHTESGKLVPEDPSTNRARNGHGGKPRFKADSSAGLTPSLIRADKKCGKSGIPDGQKCSKKTLRNAAITAGVVLGSTALLASALRSKKGAVDLRAPGIKPPTVRTPPPAPKPNSIAQIPQRLARYTPEDAGSLTKARLGRTGLMRANVQAAQREAEGMIAQTARQEVRRIGQIGLTMATVGEAAGMTAKKSVRDTRLRIEAARRKFEPGYRKLKSANVPPWTDKDQVEFDLAKARGQKWDEFEKNQDVPRCDGLQNCSRRVGDPSFFAQYVVGLDEKTGFKSPAPRHRMKKAKYPLFLQGQMREHTVVHPGIARTFDNEAVMLALANQKGVDAPKLFAYNPKTHVLKMEHLGEYGSAKSLGEPLDYFLDPILAGRYLNSLEKLHRAGIAHTDLHSGNVMIHKIKRDIKILDFGTAMDARWGPDEVSKYVGERVVAPTRPMSGRDYLYVDIIHSTRAVTSTTIPQAEMNVILKKTIGERLPDRHHWGDPSSSDVIDRRIAEYYAEIRKSLLAHTSNGTALATQTGVFSGAKSS